MGTTVLKGGRVIDQTGERTADVVIGDDGRIAGVGADLSRRPHPRRRRLRGQPRASSTSTATSASPARRRPRPSRPAPGRPPSAATRASSPCPTRSRPSTTPASCARCSSSGAPAPCDVRTSGAITVGRAGEQLAPLGEMAELGVRFFTDDGAGVADTRLMRRALEYAASLPGVVLAQHCEDPVLSAGGHMHEGEWSSRLGIPGQPAEAEELMVLRDLALARLTGTRVHFQHLSTARSIEMVRAGQGRRPPRHLRGHHPPLHAHPRRVRELRPGVQGEPAAAHRRRRGRGARRPGRRRHRLHRHRPRAPHPGGQGGGLRPGAARDARPRDGAGPRPHRARPQDRPGARAAVVAAGPHPRRRRPARPPGRAGQPGQPHGDRPVRHLDRRPRRSSPAAAATPPTPAAPSPAGSATPSCSASRWSSMGKPSGE